MADQRVVLAVREKFEVLEPIMDERVRRHWAASEALALGRGGTSAVCEATGISRTTIRSGIAEIQEGSRAEVGPRRLRRPGGGRPPLTGTHCTLIKDLERLVAPTTRGDPQSPLLWTLKSTRKLSEELTRQGSPASPHTVAALLHEIGYSLQSNRKAREGSSHPDRNAQFEYINQRVRSFQRRRQPVVSVDTKKKELVGDFKNGGREWRPKGSPERVRTHDFLDRELGKAIPYGVYDLTANEGWVSVGIDHDTARFATATLKRWWRRMGSRLYPDAKELLVTADSGGSNSSRSRLWKVALQELANHIRLKISVCHFPPGTSKWNKIEHRMFCYITENWRGKPLLSHEVIVNLIGHTTTRAGLRIKAQLDPSAYEAGIHVTDDELDAVQIKKHRFQGAWNYTISPY